MSQFSPDNDTWASESAEASDVHAGPATTKRRLLALGAAGSAVLLTVGAWVVLTAGDDQPLETLQPIAANPFLTPAPLVTPAPVSPGPTGAATPDPAGPLLPSLAAVAGRDPFVPLVAALVTPVAGTSGSTPYPSVTPTPYPSVTPTPHVTGIPTPTATPTPAPAGKKKPPPTNGPVL